MLVTGDLHQLLLPSPALSKAQPLWVHTAGTTRVRTVGWQKQARECPGRGPREASAHRSRVRSPFQGSYTLQYPAAFPAVSRQFPRIWSCSISLGFLGNRVSVYRNIVASAPEKLQLPEGNGFLPNACRDS